MATATKAASGREVSVKEAAEILGINRRSVIYAIEDGNIQARKEAGFLFKCSYASVMAYKRSREKRLASQAVRTRSRHKTAKKAAASRKPTKAGKAR